MAAFTAVIVLFYVINIVNGIGVTAQLDKTLSMLSEEEDAPASKAILPPVKRDDTLTRGVSLFATDFHCGYSSCFVFLHRVQWGGNPLLYAKI